MSIAAPATKAEPLWFLDNLAYVHIDGAQTGDAYALGEIAGRRGDMPPLHVHHRDDEVFYVLDGELTLFVGDEVITVTPGGAAFAPRGVPHAYRVESATARWLTISNPAGFERFVRAMSEPAEREGLPPAGRAFDPAELTRVAGEYGIELLAPPGTLPGSRQL
jgi:quercetin dioxygenase-like cupin family protein